MIVRATAAALPLVALCCAPAVGVGAPSLSDPVLSPSSWNDSPTALVGWTNNDFGSGVAGSALVQVNRAADGTETGAWDATATVAGPHLSGVRSTEFPVAGLEGRHRVRIVVEGVANSPLDLGVLQLDRTPPSISAVRLTPEGGPVVADWIQSDALSGTDPAEPVVVEVNADPGAGAGPRWAPFQQQPSPGDGRKIAGTNLAGLADGSHLVRARTRDRAGNVAERVLGTVVSDHTPPVVTGVRVSRAPNGPTAIAEIAYTAVDPSPGVGLVGAPAPRVGPAGASDDVDWTSPGASGPGRVAVRLPRAGVHAVTVRVRDRLGNRAESARIAIRLPSAAQAADARVAPAPAPGPAGGEPPGARASWAYGQVRDFHARRGIRLAARLRVARSAAAWRRLLGVADARTYSGFATFRGEVYLGPPATRALERLATLRARAVRGARGSRADLDAVAMGLAVLLHETLHATGPSALADVTATRSGRAFEEGVTEAATLDLLGPFAAGLDLPRDLRARLVAAVGRYRPAYRAQVAWARRLSARATGAPSGSRRAAAWRVRVADTWGADRWARLAVATGAGEEDLRAGAPG